jgi:hypothetical protein
MPGWAAASVLGLLAAVATGPMNVRLAVLGMWGYVPGGLADLGGLLSRRGPGTGVVRAIGLVSLGLVVLLAWWPTISWMDSVFLAISGWII